MPQAGELCLARSDNDEGEVSRRRQGQAHGQGHSEDEPLDLGTVDFDHKGIGTGNVEPKLVEVDRHGDCLSIARRTLNDN